MRKAAIAVWLTLACGGAAAQMNDGEENDGFFEDNGLGDTETAGEYDDWDVDNNGDLNLYEFVSGIDDAGIYGPIDQDDDGFIEEEEFEDAGYEGDDDAWDADDDGYVDASEFYQGLFDVFDEDGDGAWDEDEFDTANEGGWLGP